MKLVFALAIVVESPQRAVGSEDLESFGKAQDKLQARPRLKILLMEESFMRGNAQNKNI